MANLLKLKFETYLGFKWSYNTLLFVLEASETSVACYEAPNFVDFTLFSMGLELVECTPPELTNLVPFLGHVGQRDRKNTTGLTENHRPKAF